MSEWLPIKNAPKDTKVLLLSPHGARSGKWRHPQWEGDDCWEYDRYPSDGCGCCSYSNEPPTHYMLLQTDKVTT